MVTALERVAAERHESFRQAPEHRVDRVESYRSNRSARSGARPTVERVESRVRHPTLIGSAPPPRAKDHRRHSHHRDHADGSEGPRFHGPDWRLFFKPAAKPRAAPAYAGFSVVWWAKVVNGIGALIVFVSMIMGFIAYQAQVAGPSIVLLVFHAWLYGILFYFHRAAQYLAFIVFYAIYLFAMTIAAIVWLALSTEYNNDRYALVIVWFTFHMLTAIFGGLLIWLVFVLMKVSTIEENVASGRGQVASAVRSVAPSQVSLRADKKLDVSVPGPITIRVPSAEELRSHHQERLGHQHHHGHHAPQTLEPPHQHVHPHHHHEPEEVQHRPEARHREEVHHDEVKHVQQEARPVPRPRSHSPVPRYDVVPEQHKETPVQHEDVPVYDTVPGDAIPPEKHAHSEAHDDSEHFQPLDHNHDHSERAASEENNGHKRLHQTSSHESYVQIEYPDNDRDTPAPIFVDIAPYLSKSVRIGDSLQLAVTVHVVPKRTVTTGEKKEEHKEEEKELKSDEAEEEEVDEEGDQLGSSSDVSLEPEQGSMMETPQLPRAKTHKRSTSVS
ncbi:hypothetical protein AAVH_12257 [Aphelenchoides avenae]|nr:hypothetical protein AAVH_12257 [Aphelenchus avenae]